MHPAQAYRPKLLVSGFAGFLAALGVVGAQAATPDPDPLLAGFRQPPPAARPQVWWHWMNGNVDLEGAKLDLAWMQQFADWLNVAETTFVLPANNPDADYRVRIFTVTEELP